MSQAPTDIDSMVQDLREYSRQMVRELGFLEAKWAEEKISYAEFHALFEIDQKGINQMSQLAHALQIHKSSVSRMVKKLEKRGLIEVLDSQNDGRGKVMRTTPQAKVILESIGRKAQSKVRTAMVMIPHAAREGLVQSMRTYAQALRNTRLTQDMAIKPIEKKYAEGMSQIVKKVLEEFNFAIPGTVIEDEDLNDLYSFYQKHGHAYFVIVDRAELVGGGGIRPLEGEKSSICELTKMYIRSEYRGLGLGRKLLCRCLAFAKDYGYKSCYLETIDKMNVARHLYAQFGFQELSSRKGNTGHSSCDRWMSLALENYKSE